MKKESVTIWVSIAALVMSVVAILIALYDERVMEKPLPDINSVGALIC